MRKINPADAFDAGALAECNIPSYPLAILTANSFPVGSASIFSFPVTRSVAAAL